MSAAAGFLQRVVAAAGAAAPARAAAAARGPLTLGQFLRRRRSIFFRAAAMTLARATTEELEEEDTAGSAPPPEDAVQRAPLVRRAVPGPAEASGGDETAAGAETAAPPSFSEAVPRGSPDIARLANVGSRPVRAHDPAGNSQPNIRPGSPPADTADRATPVRTAEVNPPPHRPAAADSAAPLREAALVRAGVPGGNPVELPRAEAASGAMALSPSKEILPVPSEAAQPAAAFSPAALFHPFAEAQARLPAAAELDQASGSSAVFAAAATEQSAARFRQTTGAPPAFQEPALLPPGAPYAGAAPSTRPPANEARTAEPVVQIGNIEIIIEAAAEPRTPASAPPAPAQDFASRFYLRGL